MCDQDYSSEYAFFLTANEKVKINIKDAILGKSKGEKYQFFCENGHDLEPVNSVLRKQHFRHSNPNHKPMSEWHKMWQDHFPSQTEKVFKYNDERRIADIYIEPKNLILEIQHSKYTSIEIIERSNFYRQIGKTILWIVDIAKCDLFKDKNDEIVIAFDEDGKWITENFMSEDIIIGHKNNDDVIYPIHPKNIKGRTYHSKPIFLNTFLDDVVNNDLSDASYQPILQSSLRIQQKGAGNGKTFSQVGSADEIDSYLSKHCNIYLSKMHSAKNVIYEKFTERLDDKSKYKLNYLKYIDEENPEKETHEQGNQLVMELENKHTKINKLIVIGTIDSFLHNLISESDKRRSSPNLFVDRASWVSTYQSFPSKIRYATCQVRLDGLTTIHIDECQDLEKEYLDAFMALCKKNGVDVVVVGDALQSILNSCNMMTELSKLTDPFILRDEPLNVCRRFTNPHLCDLVNKVVPFKEYKLPEIVLADKVDDIPKESVYGFYIFNKKEEGEDNKSSHYIEDIWRYIKNKMDELILESKKCNDLLNPKDFLFIHPFIGKSEIMSRLEEFIQSYWEQRVKDDKGYISLKTTENPRYVKLHASEENQPIRLSDSDKLTRLVSIHSSKGDGRKVVFAIELSEKTLKRFTDDEKNIQYESLLHVAITRQIQYLFMIFDSSSLKDDVCSRFDIGDADKDIEPEFKHKHDIETKDIQTFLTTHKPEECIKLLEYIRDGIEFKENSLSKIIEWKEHLIRFSMLCYYFRYGIITSSIQLESYDQFRTCLKKLSKCKVKIFDYYNFFKGLGNIKKTKSDHDKNIHDKKPIEIPLMSRQKKSEVVEKVKSGLENIIKRIGETEFTDLIFSPLECILCMYLMDVFDHNYNYGKDNNPSVMNLYDIFGDDENDYTKFFNIKDDIIASTTNYIDTYVDKTKKWTFLSENNKIKDKEDSPDWSISKNSQIILYTEGEVHLVYLVPQYNKINAPEKRLNMLIDSHLFSVSLDPRISEKKIRTFLITLDHKQAIEITIDTSILKDCELYKCYLNGESEKHMKQLWKLYEYWENHPEKCEKNLCKHKHGCNPIKHLTIKFDDKNNPNKYVETKLYTFWADLKDDEIKKIKKEKFDEEYKKLWEKRVRIKFQDWK